MLWAMTNDMGAASDFLFILFVPIIVTNIVIVLMVFIKDYLEKILSMCQLNKLLKGFMLYISSSLLVITGYIVGRFLITEKLNVISNDVSELSFVRDKTIANATSFGGNLIFLILLAVWFIGIFALGINQLIKERAFLKKLDRLSELITDGTSIETKDRLIEEMGIKKDFRVFINSIIPSPFIIGFVKPKIFLSENSLSDLETEIILRHEMTHLKAKDYFHRRLMFMLCVMYWFNPAVHIFLNKFIEINEMACDEATLKNYSDREKLIYAKLLRDMACSKPDIENIICLTGKTTISLQRRIINIMNSKKMMKRIPYIALSTLILGICPVISYAATNSSIDMQTYVIDMLDKDIEETADTELIEQQEMDNTDITAVMLEEAVPMSGSVDIDINVDGKIRVITNTVYMRKGSKVTFTLYADNSDNKFRIGLLDSKNKKVFVNSKSGEARHTFTVNTSGEYRLFIEGLENKNIHITGSIYIKN